MDLRELADQMNAGDTRQALAELAREMTVCKAASTCWDQPPEGN